MHQTSRVLRRLAPRIRPGFVLTLACLGTPAVLSSLCLTSPVIGQDDLFGDPDGAGDLFGDPLDFDDPGGLPVADVGNNADDEAKELSPLVQQLIERRASGPVEQATAIRDLARISRWTEVDQALRQLDLTKLSATAQAAMASAIGPSQYIRIGQQAKVSDEAKRTLETLSKASLAYATSDKRIGAAIANLDSESEDARLAAARTLFEGGEASIEGITKAIVALDPVEKDASDRRDSLLRVLRRFEGRAFEPLQRLALYGTLETRGRAAAALARVGDRRFTAGYVTAAFAPDSQDFARQAGARAINRIYGRVISPNAAVQFLANDLDQKRQAAQLLPRGQAVQSRWACDQPGCQDLQVIETTSFLSAYRDAVDAAARLTRVANLTPDLATGVLAAQLEYRLAVNSDWGLAEEVEQLTESLLFSVDTDLIERTLREASDSDNELLSLGMLRLIVAIRTGEVRTSEANLGYADPLLLNGVSSPSSLVRLASSAETRVRYEAAILASKLSGGAAYPGSSQVRRTLSEMLTLGDRPQAILVETRQDVALRMEQIVNALGYDVTIVPDVGRLQRAILRGGDLRLILSKMQLSDLPPVELIDMVRRTPRARAVPIVFFGEPNFSLETSIRENRWKATTMQIENPRSVAAFAPLIDAVGRISRFDPLTSLDRRALRQLAIEQLDLEN